MLKLSTTLKSMPLTHCVYLHSPVRRWTQNTFVFSYTHRWEGFLKVDHRPVFELWEPFQSFLLEKQSPLAAQNWSQNSLGRHIQPAWWTKSLQGRTTTVFKSTDKVAAFKAKLELWEWQVNVGISDIFQTLAEILKETEPGSSFSQLCVITRLSFQKSLSITPQPQKMTKLGIIGSMTHLWIGQVSWLCPC